jgi:hypothetical protein
MAKQKCLRGCVWAEAGCHFIGVERGRQAVEGEKSMADRGGISMTSAISNRERHRGGEGRGRSVRRGMGEGLGLPFHAESGMGHGGRLPPRVVVGWWHGVH